MPEDIVVVGAGGFGREALDVIEAINDAASAAPWRVIGVVDDRPAPIQVERLAARGYAHLGSAEQARQRFPSVSYAIGVGSPRARAHLADEFEAAGWVAATLLHPTAVIGSKVLAAEGSVVCGGVQLSTNTRLGRHVHLNPGVIVGHDSTLADFVSVNPGAILSGEVTVESEALIGAGAVILQGLRVGSQSVVGASACVTRDVASGSVVKGVPAR